jgi:fucose 4-O-acetylase-like acetyltransferase
MARRADIDCAKGLAILLVVFGHIVARADPAGVDWYEPLRRAVYAFHMPFFLYLSGMVAALSGAAFTPPTAWRRLAASRVERLLLPFLGLGLLVVAGKVAAGSVMYVDNRPAALGDGLLSLVWHTAASPAMSVWYLFVLFVVSLATPVLVWADAGRLRLLLAAGLVLYCLPLPAYVYADRIGQYMIFFVAGVWAGRAGEGWTRLVDRDWRWLGVMFCVALALIIRFGCGWPPGIELLPVGALSMPVLHGLVRNCRADFTRVFLWLGRYSFMIYLFNTMFIGLAKGLLLLGTDWNGPHFIPFATCLMAAGIFGPVALKQLAFTRIKRLDRLTS